MAGPFGEALQRRFKIAFGIDQEVGGNHTASPSARPCRTSTWPVRVAELDLARLEPPLPLVDEHGLPAAGIHHRALGHGQHRRAAAGVDFGIDIHVVQQQEIRILQVDANTRGPRLLVDLGINHRDLPCEFAPGKRPRPHDGGLADGEGTEIAFGDIDQRPDQ